MSNQEINDLKDTLEYAVIGARVDVNHCKEFTELEASDSNKKCLREAVSNLSILKECEELLKELIGEEPGTIKNKDK